jgi:phosphopantothenate---cysteine ligase (CTP)
VNCIVTAGPTYEPLDEVRRLTNLSTGRLGSELAGHLAAQGHRVILLKGHYSVYREDTAADQLITFTTSADLAEKLESLAGGTIEAVFHAAAVSDFRFGTVFERLSSGKLIPIKAGKFTTRRRRLLAELVPTPKIIRQLRTWYPQAHVTGWKYEVDGTREGAMASGLSQIQHCCTDACVVNGPAYGDGFWIVQTGADCLHVANRTRLFEVLEGLPRRLV